MQKNFMAAAAWVPGGAYEKPFEWNPPLRNHAETIWRIRMKVIAAAILSLFLCFFHPATAPAFNVDEDDPDSADIARLRIQAEKGDPETQYEMGEAYLKGEGVDQSEREAAKWYSRSAAQGYVDAQVAMGFVYRGRDKVLSYMWFDLAAKNGSTAAYSLRSDEAWSMTQSEVDEARKKSREWRPKLEKGNHLHEDEEQ
jgi:TPR repeat protein